MVSMRSSRLVALLLTLQRRGHSTAAELARELEVSVRTLYRDVAALMTAGVPIWTEPGPHGGIRLVEGWRTRLDGLTADEASALFLAGAPQALSDLGLATVAVSARAKVDATLPPELRSRSVRIRERFVLDAPGWFAKPESLSALPIVAEAVWSNRRLDIRYGKDKARRRVDPLGLVLKAGVWYLVARHRTAIRTFRISRLAGAKTREDGFERPEGFDLARWWGKASADFEMSLLKYPCSIRVSERGLSLLGHLLPYETVRDVIANAGLPDEDGWHRLSLLLESEEVAASQLVGLGIDIEVLEPLSLRQRLCVMGEAMMRNHGR